MLPSLVLASPETSQLGPYHISFDMNPDIQHYLWSEEPIQVESPSATIYDLHIITDNKSYAVLNIINSELPTDSYTDTDKNVEALRILASYPNVTSIEQYDRIIDGKNGFITSISKNNNLTNNNMILGASYWLDNRDVLCCNPLSFGWSKVELTSFYSMEITESILSSLHVGISQGSAECHRIGSYSNISKVSADEVLNNIQNGNPIKYDNYVIDGDLNLSNLVLNGSVHFNNTLFRDTVDFGSVTFNDAAYFMGAKFEKDAYFLQSSFRGDAFFDYASFNSTAFFWGSDFDADAYFGCADFNGVADFMDSRFKSISYFEYSIFNRIVSFRYSYFGDTTSFNNSIFKSDAYFGTSNFNGNSYFGNTFFNNSAYFESSSFKGNSYFLGSNFNGKANFWYSHFNSNANFMNSVFNETIDFRGSMFKGNTYFDYSTFNKDAYFGYSKFDEGPSFIDSKFGRNVSFIFSEIYSNVLILGEDASIIGTLDLTNSSINRIEGYVRWNNIGHLVYDIKAYNLLFDNYKQWRLFDDYNCCYYSFKVESLKHRSLDIGKLLDYIQLYLYGFGLRPELPIIWSMVIILISSAFFYITNGIQKSNTESTLKVIYVKGYTRPKIHLKNKLKNMLRQERTISLFEAVLFSSIYFTSGGINIITSKPEDFIPIGNSRYVAVIDRLLGWVFFALFISSIGNIMTHTI